MILYDAAEAECVQNFIDTLGVRVALDVREALFQLTPSVFNAASADERILLMDVKFRMIDPEMIPTIFSEMRFA